MPSSRVQGLPCMIWLPPTSLTHLKFLHLTPYIPTSLSSFLTFVQSQLTMLFALQQLCLLSGKLFSWIVIQMTISYDPRFCSQLTSSKKTSLASKSQVVNSLTLSPSCCFSSFTTSIAILYFLAYLLPVFLQNIYALGD